MKHITTVRQRLLRNTTLVFGVMDVVVYRTVRSSQRINIHNIMGNLREFVRDTAHPSGQLSDSTPKRRKKFILPQQV